MQRTRQRRLEVHTVYPHPRPTHGRVTNYQTSQTLVGQSASHREQILPVLLLRIRVDQHVLRSIVHAAQVAHVHRIATAPRFRGRLHEQYVGTGFARDKRRAKAALPPPTTITSGLSITVPVETLERGGRPVPERRPPRSRVVASARLLDFDYPRPEVGENLPRERCSNAVADFDRDETGQREDHRNERGITGHLLILPHGNFAAANAPAGGDATATPRPLVLIPSGSSSRHPTPRRRSSIPP